MFKTKEYSNEDLFWVSALRLYDDFVRDIALSSANDSFLNRGDVGEHEKTGGKIVVMLYSERIQGTS